MKRFFAILFLILMLWYPKILEAKNSDDESGGGLALYFGPTITYFHGEHSDDFDSFETDRVNWQLDMFFGFYTGQSDGGTALGVFGAVGYSNKFTFGQMAEYANINMINVVESRFNSFYQVEGGFLLANVLRLSTGVGKQYYTTSGGDDSFNYLSSTAGFLINMGTVSWSLNANFNYGRDYSDTILKLSTGIVFVF